VSRELLVQEAQRRNLYERPEVRAELEKIRRFVLVHAMLEDYARAHQITETALRDAYNREKARLGKRQESTEYRLRQILVPTESSAREALRRLTAGESFAHLATELSVDPLSRDKGGDLGWVLPTQLVSPVDAAVRALGRKGLATNPVVSPLGWHVIEIEETRPFQMPSFEESRGRIAQELALQQRQALVAELRRAAKIQ
jgi:peptidyl-prolyl cis-trans isomerase C